MTRAADWTPAHADVLLQLLTRHANQPGALLPLLHDIQATWGYVPPACVPQVAQALNLSRAEVHGVISYYHDFRERPQPPHLLRVCQAEACQACGSAAVLAQCEALLGCRSGSASADGQWALEPVYCLGLCAQSPAIAIDGQLHARVSPQHIPPLLHAAHAARAKLVAPTTQEGAR